MMKPHSTKPFRRPASSGLPSDVSPQVSTKLSPITASPVDFSAPLADGPGAEAPANQELVDRAKAFNVELPALLGNPVRTAREFFLREVFIPELAVTTGLHDAEEVIQLAFGEKPASSKYVSTLQGMASEAIMCRAVFKLSDILSLDARSSALFLQLQLSKHNSRDAPTQPKLKEILERIVSAIPENEKRPYPGPTRREKAKRKAEDGDE